MIQTRADSKLTIWYGLNGPQAKYKLQRASSVSAKKSKHAVIVPTGRRIRGMNSKSILVSSKGSQANAKEIKKTLKPKVTSETPISSYKAVTTTHRDHHQQLGSSSLVSPPPPSAPVASSEGSRATSTAAPRGMDDWDAQPIVPLEFSNKVDQEAMIGQNSLLGVINATLESDADDNDGLLYNKMDKKDVSFESELDESIFSVEDDEHFKVHFAHIGKKSTDPIEEEMNHRPDLAQQILELQEAVVSMKASLKDAVTNLSIVVGDSSSGIQVEEMKNKCDGNSAEILKMVLALRTDLSSLKNDVTSICSKQDSLHKSVGLLLEDRRALANDLSHAGVISQHTRNRLDCFNGVVEMIGTGGHSGSGSHSNDSGVALMVEKTQGSFVDETGILQSSAGNRISDQDSLPEQPSLLVPSSVYDYVAGLNEPNLYHSNANCQLSSLENEAKILDNVDDGTNYDSDSSMTIAVNKSMNLNSCLSQELRANDSYVSQSTQTQGPVERSRKKKIIKGDSDLNTRETSTRRRRPLLGVSSTKMYQMTSHPHTSFEKERHKKHRLNDHRESQRYKIAKELLDTEKKYCKTLWTIQETFAEPLKKAAILSNKDIATLFPEEVYQLYDKHCLLQHQLKERLTSWKWQPIIGDILVRFTDPRHCEILRIYSNYVNDFPEILKTFHKLCHTSQPFTEFIKGCLDQPSCCGQDLGAFLLTPVQRVPQYILILKQLIKCTDSSHPDYRLISICLERLRDFLSHLNDAMEDSFQLVHSSLTAAAVQSSSGFITTATSSKQRAGRSQQKSDEARESPSSSPSDRRNRHTRVYQPESSSSEAYRSPQRSTSNAGPNNQKQTTSHYHLAENRSASLPRGFLSSSDGSGADAGPESSPEGLRVRSGSGSRGLKKSNSTSHETKDPSYEAMSSSRSVSNMITSTSDICKCESDTCRCEIGDKNRWENLASSQPSLIDAKIKKTARVLTSAHSTQSIATSHKLVTWTDSLESDETHAKKKSSIKSSLKNIFGFKKSRSTGHTSAKTSNKEEPIYWPSSVSSVIIENSEISPDHQPYSSMSTIGDFVDEEGNPCSNV